MPRIWADIIVAAQSTMAKMRHRLERTTTRERVLLFGLVLAGALYAPVYALDSRAAQSDAYVDAVGDQTSARLAAQNARRIQAKAVDSALIADMQTWGFKAQNASIAQVLIEHRLVTAAEKVGLLNPVITVQPQVHVEGPTHWMSVEVQTDLRWAPAFAFIDEVGEWPEGFRLTNFKYEILPQRQMSRSDEVLAERGTITYRLAFPVQLEVLPQNTTNSANSSVRETRS